MESHDLNCAIQDRQILNSESPIQYHFQELFAVADFASGAPFPDLRKVFEEMLESWIANVGQAPDVATLI